MSQNLETVEDQLLALANGDPERAALLIEAIEERRKRENFIRYYLPHPGQQEFWKQLTPEQDTWLVLGGNSSGKSDLGEFIVAAWCLGKDFFKGERNWEWVSALPIPPPPNNVRGVGLNSDMLKDPMWEKLVGSTEHPPFIPPSTTSHVNNQSFLINFKNGSKFQGKSADVDPKTHGGPTCALVHIDEECGYEIFKENQRRIRGGGKILVTATPLDDVGTTKHPWIFDLIEKWKAGDATIGVIFMAMDKNPHLDPEFVRRERTRLEGLPDAQARLFGIPTRRSGLYYSMWKPQAPLWVPAYPLARKAFRALMIDPASTGPVGALWAAFDERGKMTLYRCYKKKGLTVSEHVENIIAENRGDPLNLLLMDPFMGRQTVPAATREGQKKVIDIWREAGMGPRLRLAEVDYPMALEESREYMKAAFDPFSPHPAVEIFDHLTELKEELDRYIVDSVVQGHNKGDVKDRPRKGNSDLTECYQYLCGMGLRQRGMVNTQLVDPSLRSYCN